LQIRSDLSIIKINFGTLTTPNPSQEGNNAPPLRGEIKSPLGRGFRGGLAKCTKTMNRKKIIPYNPKLKERARYLRNNSTLSEVLLWQRLKGKQMLGYDFDRQKPIDNYIVDFFCNELMLAIEIDGDSHAKKVADDQLRQQRLESLGVRFLRFYDRDVKQNMAGVLSVIENWIWEHKEQQ
jgi:very-short-patch-repair endonuclease